MQHIFEHAPLWLIIVALGYVAVMLTIAVIRGQEVQFFPPKIGERGSHSKEPIEAMPKKAKQFSSNIEGIWGDWFFHDGEIRAALIRLRRTDSGFDVRGFEFNEENEEVCYWTSDVGRYRESTGEFDYLFKSKETVGDQREFHGFTCLEFIGSDEPTEYRGYFVDVYEFGEKERETRSGILRGKRIAGDRESSFDENQRKLYANNLIRIGKLEYIENENTLRKSSTNGEKDV